jgi:Kef-type K+ transport system membrane component KefB
MSISRRSKRRSKLGPVVGYSINGLVHAPEDVTIIYGKKHQPVRKTLWYVWQWIRLHRKGLLLILLVIALCILSAVITAHHPT